MDGHQKLTLNFINSVLSDLGMGPLQKVVIKNPFNVKESVTDKERELMEKYEARQKYIRDVSTIKGVSHDEGFAKGKEEGRQEGRQEGEQIGIHKGRQEGEQIGIHKVVVTMHQKEFDAATIAKSTGLSVEEIETILAVEK